MSDTSSTTSVRKSDSWPKHRAKARRRNLARKGIARAAQAQRDREARGL